MKKSSVFERCGIGGRFTQLLAKKLCTSPRRALSAHTTTACQPKKADGPGGSLKDVGMDDILPAVGGGQFFVRVNLPHAFSYGDGLAVTYVSTAEKDAKAVQNQACLELLCYLVVSAPGRVRLPPGCFVQGGVDIDDFRAKAIEFSQQVGFTEQSLAWQIPEIHAGQPLAALAAFGQHAGPGQPLAAMQPIAPPPAAAGPIEPAVGGDEAVLEILRSLRINTEYQTAKRRIPTAIGKQLEPVLRKHGLLPFLQRYPQYFDVTLTGGVTSNKKPQYTFKMKAAINDVAAIQPAVGGGAAVAAPAVAVGNNTVPHGIMSDWDVNGMVSFLESISLGHLSKAFMDNGLDGAFFLQCSQEELAEIGLTALQFKKIMAYAPGGPKNQ